MNSQWLTDTSGIHYKAAIIEIILNNASCTFVYFDESKYWFKGTTEHSCREPEASTTNSIHRQTIGNSISMSRIQVTIIEDEFFAADHLSELVTSLGYEVRGVFHSGEEFLKLTDWQFDVAIVDIFLSEELSGLDIGAQLKERLKPFIFLTANKDNITLREAARLNPKAYISKPFQANDVAAALQIISFGLPKKLEIRGNHGKGSLSTSDILFIKSDGVYVEIHTRKGSIVQRKLLKEIVDELPENFIRVHRSYLINKDYIEQRQPNQVIVHGHHIPISRNYKENLEH